MDNTLEIKRGDCKIIYLSIPTAITDGGATAYFMAKTKPDDDTTDSSAQINKTSETTLVDGETTRYLFNIQPNDTKNVKMGGRKTLKLKGEFEVRTNSGKVYSFPSNDRFIEVKIYADIRRGA